MNGVSQKVQLEKEEIPLIFGEGGEVCCDQRVELNSGAFANGHDAYLCRVRHCLCVGLLTCPCALREGLL